MKIHETIIAPMRELILWRGPMIGPGLRGITCPGGYIGVPREIVRL